MVYSVEEYRQDNIDRWNLQDTIEERQSVFSVWDQGNHWYGVSGVVLVRKLTLDDICDMLINPDKVYYYSEESKYAPIGMRSGDKMIGNSRLYTGKKKSNNFRRSFTYGRANNIILYAKDMLNILLIQVNEDGTDKMTKW